MSCLIDLKQTNEDGLCNWYAVRFYSESNEFVNGMELKNAGQLATDKYFHGEGLRKWDSSKKFSDS